MENRRNRRTGRLFAPDSVGRLTPGSPGGCIVGPERRRGPFADVPSAAKRGEACAMSGQEPEKTVCLRCSGPLDPGEKFCPRCRAPTGGPIVYHPRPRRDLAQSRGMVLFLLFAALGPLALPVLWRSPKFSRAWKILLTLLVVILTAVVVWLLWYVIHRLVESLREYGILESF